MIKGEKLRYYRKKMDITQEELCHGICSTTYLSKLENNKMQPTEDILLSNRKISAYFDYLKKDINYLQK